MSKILNSCESVLNAIDAKLQGLNYHQTIPALIYGVKCDLTEPQVRALQAIVRRLDDEAFEKFNANVTIWSGPEFRRKMEFRRNGRFLNEFEDGFFNVCYYLTFQLL